MSEAKTRKEWSFWNVSWEGRALAYFTKDGIKLNNGFLNNEGNN
jgi:hypothetical protein